MVQVRVPCQIEEVIDGTEGHTRWVTAVLGTLLVIAGLLKGKCKPLIGKGVEGVLWVLCPFKSFHQLR